MVMDLPKVLWLELVVFNTNNNGFALVIHNRIYTAYTMLIMIQGVCRYFSLYDSSSSLHFWDWLPRL